MAMRLSVVVLALALMACDTQTSPGAGGGAGEAPQLDAPAPESDPARVFAPSNDSARSTTGQLTVSMALRLPDDQNGDARDTLTLTGANGVTVEAEITDALSPATMVQGQTLRALLDIPVEEPQVLVYRVTNETRPESGQGLCGADAPSHVVVWEPAGPGEAVMKLMGVAGGAPGAADSRACPRLDYRRA